MEHPYTDSYRCRSFSTSTGCSSRRRPTTLPESTRAFDRERSAGVSPLRLSGGGIASCKTGGETPPGQPARRQRSVAPRASPTLLLPARVPHGIEPRFHLRLRSDLFRFVEATVGQRLR